MEPTKNSVNQLRGAQLYIAEEIKRICAENGIQYFLDCGSLLGAVRHRGFIPWDDDMDIGMLKADYDRFVAIAPSALGKDFFLDEISTEDRCAIVYAKVRLRNTLYDEDRGSRNAVHNEIFVDIFPYIPTGNDMSRWRRKGRRLAFYGWALSAKAGYRDWKGGFIKRLLFLPSDLLGKLASYPFLHRRILAIRDEQREESKVCMCDGWLRSLMNYPMPREIFDRFIDAEFEGHVFPIPAEYDQYLTIMYGDYMKLPPVEDRVTHEVRGLDFGPYDFH